MISAQGRGRLYFHSPLGFLRDCGDEVAAMQQADLEAGMRSGDVRLHGDDVRLWLRHLGWDSRFFDCPTYRLDFADWPAGGDVAAVAAEVRRLVAGLEDAHPRFYLFAEVPSEDIVLLQALGLAGLGLVETRLTYVHDALAGARPEALASARAAGSGDVADVRAAAIDARNDFDRYHADPFFAPATADAYLAEYAEQCVRGFSDVVLVPGDDAPCGAFVCGKADIAAPANLRIGRLQLAGVTDARRGWYRSLNEALLRWMHERGMSHVVNTTQSTNRAVIHVSTQLGYRYGRAAHILALGRSGSPQ
jgi:dTDP-4-amino-4,6-dideoxy-D-galactose acyltransferase